MKLILLNIVVLVLRITIGHTDTSKIGRHRAIKCCLQTTNVRSNC